MKCVANSASYIQVILAAFSNNVKFYQTRMTFACFLASATILVIYFEQPNICASTIHATWLAAT